MTKGYDELYIKEPSAEPVTPATDEEIAEYGGDIAIYQRGVDRHLHCVRCDASPGEMGGHRPSCDWLAWPTIKARIEQDRATVERLVAAIDAGDEEGRLRCVADGKGSVCEEIISLPERMCAGCRMRVAAIFATR